MILHKNSLIKLEYDPATDILQVDYPDLHTHLLPEIRHSIDILVDAVKNYDIKRLLLDSTKTTVSVNPEQGREIATYLAAGLQKTRIQKVARLASLNIEVENSAQNNIKHISQTAVLPFQLRNFTDRTEALAWLAG